MKKSIFPITVLLVLIILATGCSSATTTPPAATSPTTSTTTTVFPTTSGPVATSPSVLPTTSGPAPTATITKTPTPSASSSQYGGTLRYATPYSPGNPIGTPWQTVGPTSVSSQVSLEALTRQLNNGTDTPVLATSWDVDLSGPSITFHLRQGVKFHDGTDFNAAAVKWNLQKEMASDSINVAATNTWKSVDVIDNYTVKVTFSVWQNTALENFANSVAYMISPTAFDKNGLDYMQYHMVGTGPFVQTGFQRDVALTTVRNTNYWDTGKPYLDGVQLLYIADDLTRVALFKSGGAEVDDNGRNVRLARDLASSGYNIVTMLGSGNICLVPDSLNADSPWSNIKVRQAAEYAIDKNAIVGALGFGYLHALNQMYLPGSIAYDSTLPDRSYDVAKAKQLLTDAGYPNGFKTTIIVWPSGVDQNMVLAVQSYLGKIGIQATLQLPTATAITSVTNGGWKNAILFTPFQLWSNPNHTFNYFFNPGMTSYVSLKRPDGWKDMLSASMASATIDPALVKKLEDALYNDSTVIPMTDSIYPWITTDKLQDHGIGSTSTVGFWTPSKAWLSK
jgi:peptide/nickel transport system substrate-binding protein